jgi:hypothetical protein
MDEFFNRLHPESMCQQRVYDGLVAMHDGRRQVVLFGLEPGAQHLYHCRMVPVGACCIQRPRLVALREAGAQEQIASHLVHVVAERHGEEPPLDVGLADRRNQTRAVRL